jgi:hypothetical protein
MAGITLAQAEAQLALALTALAKTRETLSMTVGNRTIARQRLEGAQADVDYWDKKCQELAGTSDVARKIKVYGGTPV